MTDIEIAKTAQEIVDAVYRVLMEAPPQDPDVDAHWYQHVAMTATVTAVLKAKQMEPISKPTAPLC